MIKGKITFVLLIDPWGEKRESLSGFETIFHFCVLLLISRDFDEGQVNVYKRVAVLMKTIRLGQGLVDILSNKWITYM